MATRSPITPRSISYTPTVSRSIGILAQLCIRCGGYSASNHDFCILCVERLKKTNVHQRNLELQFKHRSANEKENKREKKEKVIRPGTYCLSCKLSDTGHSASGNLCLICEAKQREKERQKQLHRYDSMQSVFGHGDLMLTPGSTPKMGDKSWKKDWRCSVCLTRVRPEKKPMCYGCEMKQKLASRKQNITFRDFMSELEKHRQEADGVKNEFLSSEPSGDVQWEIAFQARKQSITEIKDTVILMKPIKRDEKDRQQELISHLEDLIQSCKKHFENKQPSSDTDATKIHEDGEQTVKSETGASKEQEEGEQTVKSS